MNNCAESLKREGQTQTKYLPRVLIVDDKPENLLVLETILADIEVEPVRANSGEQALALMLKHQFVAVLLDMKMPGIGSIETAKLIQGHEKTMQTPVIFVTGHGSDELDQLADYKTGSVDYIIKPVNPDILKSKVRMFLTLFMQSSELRDKYTETASLEQSLKQKNLTLERNNQILEAANLERERQYAQTRRLLDMNPDGMLVIDDNRRILFSNPSAAKLLKRDVSELQGDKFTLPLPDTQQTKLIIDDENIAEMSGVHIDWNGQNALLISLHDITALKRTEAKLFKLSQYDQLTGLANRGHCLDYLDKSLARARRKEGYLAVLFLDLDKFKDINDSRGHDEGDALLKSVANRLSTCIRKGDLVARFGGDEFALILDEISMPEDAGLIAQKILDIMATPHQLKDKPAIVGCSIGIATYPLCGKETDDLFKAADIAMFHAKSQGRNNYQFFAEEMQQKLDERIYLEQDLRQAIQRNELLLHYQPQVDVRRRKIVAMEALLRWNHSKKGFISPGQFIPIAERTGLIIEIGEWVINTACSEIKTWHDELSAMGFDKPSSSTVAINVSSKQFSKGNFRQKLQSVLNKTNFDPRYLELELTESIMMNDPDATSTELELVHQEGIDIAIDDFGTGYSSLNYLQRLPLNTLKIDQSFTAKIGENIQSEMIIKTIIAMAHNLSLRVIAEGVETARQVIFLRRLQCDLMQGYYFSKPLPFELIKPLLLNGFTEYSQSA